LSDDSTTILVVEDDPAVLTVIRLMLEQVGYRVLGATSIDSAIALSIEHADSIQLLLLDMILPGLSGLDLRDRLKAHLEDVDVPTVYMSGYPGVVCGPDVELLRKPFTHADLVGHVRKATGKCVQVASSVN
jgi:CheY-like chemotaxis protein